MNRLSTAGLIILFLATGGCGGDSGTKGFEGIYSGKVLYVYKGFLSDGLLCSDEGPINLKFLKNKTVEAELFDPYIAADSSFGWHCVKRTEDYKLWPYYQVGSYTGDETGGTFEIKLQQEMVSGTYSAASLSGSTVGKSYDITIFDAVRQ
ncbi:MAG: hypothetical protein OEY50_00640 [Nitrospinota bacterium]|nr:hypothetical protein [Nitrospinota bacterium]